MNQLSHELAAYRRRKKYEPMRNYQPIMNESHLSIQRNPDAFHSNDSLNNSLDDRRRDDRRAHVYCCPDKDQHLCGNEDTKLKTKGTAHILISVRCEIHCKSNELIRCSM